MLDTPPPPPDAINSQMGAGGPFSGIGEMLSKKPGGPPQGAADPAGALRAQGDAIKGVLEKMAASAKAGKTFFSRAIQMIEQGVMAESQSGSVAAPGPQPGTGGPEGSMAKPPAAFPG